MLMQQNTGCRCCLLGGELGGTWVRIMTLVNELFLKNKSLKIRA
jgi:hypothetical protein